MVPFMKETLSYLADDFTMEEKIYCGIGNFLFLLCNDCMVTNISPQATSFTVCLLVSGQSHTEASTGRSCRQHRGGRENKNARQSLFLEMRQKIVF